MTLLIDQLADEKHLQRHLSELILSHSKYPIHVDIPTLARTIRHGMYHPDPLFRHIRIEKQKCRKLDISRYRDRVVEKRALELVTPYAEKIFHPCSHGYRKGLGIHSAIEELIRYRDSGYRYVVRSDIADCFPSVIQEEALSNLFQLLPDNSLNLLLFNMICRPVLIPTHQGRWQKKQQELTSGLPQGLSLSPMLMNLYLTELDNQMSEHGFSLIRYADDLVVPCRTEDEAHRALLLMEEILEGIGMKLSESKTDIMSFEKGFIFLGEEFGSCYPLSAEELIKPTREKVLYVGKQGSRVRMKKGRIIIESEKVVQLADYPCKEINRIVVFGSVGVSAGIRTHCMVSGIDIAFFSRKGNFLGEQVGINRGKNISRLKAQLALTDDPLFAIPLVKEMISSKIRHQRTIVQKFKKSYCAKNYLDLTKRMLQKIAKAATIDEIRGYEGICAAQYFVTLGQIVPQEVCFSERSKRPPKDVFNAAISYGYAILLSECISALRAAGLDPAIGFMHANQDNRPNLALDFIEEFRPYVVDQLVMQLFSRKSLTKKNGLDVVTKKLLNDVTDAELERYSGIYLDADGKGKLVQAYETRMLTTTKGAQTDFIGSIRRLMYRQAQLLAKAIDTGNYQEYRGMMWR